MQSESSSFTKTMNDGLLSDKVIVVLSKSYKRKAESTKGGVGSEYLVISEDLHNKPRKYIFVSFQHLTDNLISQITPIMYVGIQILDLTKKENHNTLFAKLENENIYDMSPVNKNLPKIKKTVPAPFDLDVDTTISNRRNKLNSEIRLLLMENNTVYRLYGPTRQNSSNLFSDKYEIWQDQAIKVIIPNNNKIVELLEQNIDLIPSQKLQTYLDFKAHVRGFEENHKNSVKRSDYPLFPSSIYNVLEDD